MENYNGDSKRGLKKKEERDKCRLHFESEN